MTVESNISISELSQSNIDQIGLVFMLRAARKESAVHHWQHHWYSSSGDPILSYRKQGSCDWLHFPGLADFQILAKGKKISCYPVPKVPLETIRHLLVDQVLPRCLAYQGKVMIHASAVQLERGAILFIGDSGTGKSTLAGNFHQAGNPAISDDCVWVKEDGDQVMAVPSYGGLRLWDDSLQALFSTEQHLQGVAHYSSKKRIQLHKGDLLTCSKGIPVLAVVMLSTANKSPDQGVSLNPLSVRQAFIEIGKQTFLLYLNEPQKISHHMQSLGRIVGKLPSFRLSMPRDYEVLPLVRQKILEAILTAP